MRWWPPNPPVAEPGSSRLPPVFRVDIRWFVTTDYSVYPRETRSDGTDTASAGGTVTRNRLTRDGFSPGAERWRCRPVIAAATLSETSVLCCSLDRRTPLADELSWGLTAFLFRAALGPTTIHTGIRWARHCRKAELGRSSLNSLRSGIRKFRSIGARPC